MGVCGITHYAGATLVSIASANYLSGFRNYRVACLELNGSHAFSSLEGSSGRTPYRYMGIDFYANCSLSDLTHVRNLPYDAIVIDFGILSRGTLQAFLDCDLSVVLGYLSSWNRNCYGQWISSHQSVFKQSEICYLGNLGNEKDIREFRRRFGKALIPVPYLENPFQITSCQFYFFERVMGKFYIPRKVF